jgi:twinkle protein
VIQNRDGFKIFDIKKNRYDGDVGRVALGFNKDSKSFFELKKV